MGIRKAHLLASQRGVTIDATVNDANVWKSKEKFDVIVDVFSSLSNKTRRVRNRRWVRMLAHDGFYLNVSFAPKHREINTSGPVDLVRPEMLRGDVCTFSLSLLNPIDTHTHTHIFLEHRYVNRWILWSREQDRHVFLKVLSIEVQVF